MSEPLRLTDEDVDELRAKIRQHLRDSVLDAIDRTGISRSELARRMGTGRTYVVNSLNGTTALGIDGLIRFAMALELPITIDFGDAQSFSPSGDMLGQDDSEQRMRIATKVLAVWCTHPDQFTFGKLVQFLLPRGTALRNLTDDRLEKVLDQHLPD